MARLPVSGSDNGAWGNILNDFLLQSHQPDGTIKNDAITSAQLADGAVTNAKLDPAVQAKVNAAAPTSNPTFTGSVTVPTPINPTDAATKTYVDTAAAAGTPDASNSVKGKIQLTGDLGGTANSPTVPGLAAKEPSITAGTTNQYYRGDKSWQTLDKATVGLGNVDNTSDASKPVSTLQQTALDLKLDKAGGVLSGQVTINGSGAVNDTIFSIYNQANAREEFALKRISPSGYRILGTGFQTTSDFDAAGFGVYTSSNAAQMLSAKGIFLGTSYASAAANLGEIRTAPNTNLTLSPAGATAVTVDTTGKVGIGNTPAVALDVTGEIRASTAGSNANSVVTVGGTQTLTNKTLTSPTITGASTFTSTASTSAGGAAGTGTQPLATNLYIQSRGVGLVTNGTGMLGNNYNFPGATYIQNDKPIGATGSFYLPSGSSNSSATTTEFVPINPAKIYEFTTDARQITGSANFYMALQPRDVEGNLIGTAHYMVQANTNTTLAVALNPGDTTVTLTDATNWNNSAPAGNAYLRAMTFWDYVDPKGYAWPAGSYSRNVSGSDFWPIGGITGNVITLNAPYSGAAHPAGTQVSNSSLGATYMYVGAAGVTLPSTWTNYKGRFGGILPLYSTSAAATTLPQATASVTVGYVINYSGTVYPSQQAVANVQISEVENGWAQFTGYTAAHTYTLPNADSTILTSNAAVTVAQGGTGRTTLTTAYGLLAAGTAATNAVQTLATGTSGQILKSNGSAALPTFQTGAKADVGLANVDNTSDATKNSATATLTNKRVTPRVTATASSATPTPNADTDDQYNVTALATAATFGAPTGTPTDGQELRIRIKDNGTARALSWNAIYVSTGVGTLLATTVVNKTHLMRFRYDSTATKWACISSDSTGY